MPAFDDDPFASMGGQKQSSFDATLGAPRRSAGRRASIGQPTRARSNRERPSGNSSGPASSSRRSRDNGTSSRSLDGVLESVPGSSRSRNGDRSVASGASGTSGGDRPRRGGRRASLTAPPSSKKKEPEMDNGYGDSTAQQQSMGNGEAVPAPKPQASRRQRRCSIADVSAPVDNRDVQPEWDAPTSQQRNLGASVGNGISNMAIPMAAEEAPKKTRGRRGSIIGGIGRKKSVDKLEPTEPTKKGKDRDRRRQGTLLDRVGSNDRASSRSGPAGSYSDRILQR